MVKVKVGDNVVKIDKERALIRGLLDLALKGDVKVARLVIDLRARLRTFVDAHAENPRGFECHDAPRRDRGGVSGLWIARRAFALRSHMEGAKRMELEALSRNDHLEDFRENRVHVVCRFRARKTYASAHGVGEISARQAARILAGHIRQRLHQILH